jgi:3D (Asp-Asp-Asp) domain-containing protein
MTASLRLTILALALSTACVSAVADDIDDSIEVHASAYNSLPSQTSGRPNVAAWGDRLEPGMQVIAVSRDLLKMGMRRGTEVEIEGLPGTWRVLDKMGKRWKRRIDLYMGEDVEAARRWGVRKVRINW